MVVLLTAGSGQQRTLSYFSSEALLRVSPELPLRMVGAVLTDWTLPALDVWAVFPSGRLATARARALVGTTVQKAPPLAVHVAKPITRRNSHNSPSHTTVGSCSKLD